MITRYAGGHELRSLGGGEDHLVYDEIRRNWIKSICLKLIE